MSRLDVVFLADETDDADLNAVFEQLSRHGLSAARINPDSLSFDLADNRIHVYCDSKRLEPGLVVGWLFEKWLAPGAVLLDMISAAGYRVLNKGATLIAGQNKALMSAKLVQHCVPHSQIFASFSLDGTRRWMAGRVNDEYVGKPGFVNSGGVSVCASGQGVNRLLARELPSQQIALQNIGQPVYVQKFVRSSVPGELRVWVFGDETWAAIAKIPPHGEWIANTGRATLLARAEIEPETLNVSIRAAKAIGAQLAGVDVVRTEHGPVVLEVNTCPTFLPAEALLGDEVPKKFAAFIVKVVADQQWRLT